MSVPTSQNINAVSTYVYSLLGSKLQLANQILSNGSGGIVPTPSGGGSSTGQYVSIVVLSLSSSQITGSHTITDAAWKGLTQLSPTMTLNDGQMTNGVDYNYSILNGSFTFFTYFPQVGDYVGTFGFKP